MKSIREKIFRNKQLKKLLSADLDKINFGCGPHPLPGWANTDGGDGKFFGRPADPSIICLDVWDFVEFAPACCSSFITSEQFFEHFDRLQGHKLLAGWFRLLKPGGVLRIQMPDLEKEARIYLNILDGVSWENDVLPHRIKHISGSKDPYCKLIEGENYLPSMVINNGMHMDGHRFLYDFETIAQSLTLAGFKDVIKVGFGESPHQELRGIDRHDGGPTGKHWIPGIVLTVEATKPE